ncbi:MAG TPA: GNAT family N-acetyltransferase [bacterium]|nr:GNAT family N-acetyltransferase [bacterium]
MIVASGNFYVSQLKEIWKSVFRDSEDYVKLFFEKKYRHEDALLDVERGKVRSMLFYPRYEMSIFGRTCSAGYICGAATLPEYRGQGLMTKLLNRAFSFMSERGDSFSILIPGEKKLYGFYSGFGYLPVFKRGIAGYTLKNQPGKAKPGIVLLRTDDSERITSLYRQIITCLPVVVLQNAVSYRIAMDIYKTYGDIYIIRDGKENIDLGYLFCQQYGEGKKLLVKEIMSIKDVLGDVAKILIEIYSSEEIKFEGVYGGVIPFKAFKTAGMLKALKGNFDISLLEKGYPYMNMMLD